MVFDALLKLTPRKLNLAMLIIAVSSMTTVIVYLFKSNQKVNNVRHLDCQKELKELRSKYYDLSEKSRSEISGVYNNVLKDIKETNKTISLKMEEINKKRDEVRKRQFYLDKLLKEIKSKEK